MHPNKQDSGLQYKATKPKAEATNEPQTPGSSGKTLSEIGKELGRPQCTITREIARNTGLRGYRHN